MAVCGRLCLMLPLICRQTRVHRRFAPSLTMVRVLEEQNLSWGILINAYELRLIRRAEGFISSHISFDLTSIAESGQSGYDAWNLLWLLLRKEALESSPPLLEQVIPLGREHQEKVGECLGFQVQEAVIAFIQGIISLPANRDKLKEPISADLLRQLYAESLRVLYRILFCLYAESRGLLPLDMPTYRDGYSITRLAKLAADPNTDPRRQPGFKGRFLELGLRALFDLLRQGADLGPEGSIPQYVGALFDQGNTKRIESLTWGDQAIDLVLEKLTLVPSRKAGLMRLSYRELDVEQLGAIYENLLEKSLAMAYEPMWHIRLDDRKLIVTADELARLAERRGEAVNNLSVDLSTDKEELEIEEDKDKEEIIEEEEEETEEDEKATTSRSLKPVRILAEVPKGTVFFKAGNARKASGSYYTSRAFDVFIRVTNKGLKTVPRSFITRHLALLTFFNLLGIEPPDDIVAFWLESGVHINRQTGPVRNLRERVEKATCLGAVAYVPSTGKNSKQKTINSSEIPQYQSPHL